jgi:hypothetical protein
LAEQSEVIRGSVLEVQDDAYTRAFGADRVTMSTVVDIDDANRRATLIADLSERPRYPPTPTWGLRGCDVWGHRDRRGCDHGRGVWGGPPASACNATTAMSSRSATHTVPAPAPGSRPGTGGGPAAPQSGSLTRLPTPEASAPTGTAPSVWLVKYVLPT